MTTDPQAAVERRIAARHLLAHPLTCKEHDPEVFALIRRHESELDRWFTQRLGYRLHLGADIARLFKSGLVPERRPLRTATDRAFHHLEYVYLMLARSHQPSPVPPWSACGISLTSSVQPRPKPMSPSLTTAPNGGPSSPRCAG